jgi:archaellum component FlaD/FlaE
LKPTKSEKNVSTIKQENNETSEALKRKREDLEAEQKQQIEDARIRELKRREQLEQEDAENKRRIAKEREEQERRERAIETPKDALHRLYKPIFDSLWDMVSDIYIILIMHIHMTDSHLSFKEFEILGGVNPFRTVIDASNCAAMGAPDYCTVIKKPMNLTFIQTKVNNKSYSTLQEFLEDVDLIVKNALLYNSHPENPYNIAAKAFRKQFKKLAKPLVQSLTKGIVKTN